MYPEVFLTYKEIAKLPDQVRSLYNTLELKINTFSDLEKKLELCSGIDKQSGKSSDIDFLEVCRAKRVLEAILSCAQEQGAKEALKRIAESTLTTNTNNHSSGKDALFELEFFQYIKHRQLDARLEEPDVVVITPFGEYYVACKTINSLKNFEGQLRSAYHQIEKYGVGCIAFNLEPHLIVSEPLTISDPREAMEELSILIQNLKNEWKPLLCRRLSDGRFDGVIFQMTCIVSCTHSRSDLDTFTQSVFFCDSQLQDAHAYKRFSEFTYLMKGPFSRENYNVY